MVMEYSKWYSNENRDNFWILVALSLLVIFFIWKAIIQSWHLLFCIVCLILWIIVYFSFEYMRKKSKTKLASLWKNFEKKYPIIVQYAPPKWINPAEAWLLYNCSVEPTDLTSLIYQWKFERLIDIDIFKWKDSKREYVKLIKLEDMPLTRPLFESEIFDSIFSMWDIKIVEWSFQLRYALMLEDLEYHWIQKWWVKFNEKNKGKKVNVGRNKIWTKTTLILIYRFLVFFLIFLESLWLSKNLSNYVSVTFTEFLWFIFWVFWLILWIIFLYWIRDWWWNLKFTDKWANLASQVIGYSQFIKSCDENKIKLLLKSDPLFIDRTLPYATAFWMETEFLKKISPLKNERNAQYVNWHKVTFWMKLISFLLRNPQSSSGKYFFGF